MDDKIKPEIEHNFANEEEKRKYIEQETKHAMDYYKHETQRDFIDILLWTIAKYDEHASLWWKIEENELKFYINCNDLFYWGSADVEEITPKNITLLSESCEDCTDDKGFSLYGPELFCCRVRKMRPQGAAYKGMSPELIALFDACGPKREVGIGNPHSHPLDKEEEE